MFDALAGRRSSGAVVRAADVETGVPAAGLPELEAVAHPAIVDANASAATEAERTRGRTSEPERRRNGKRESIPTS